MRMRNILGFAVAATVAFAATGAMADAANGEKVFKSKCSACHAIEAGKTKMGPSLAGVAGRKAGTLEGFKYSPALQGAGLTWDDANLDKWIADPKATVPANRMAFPGIKDAAERADVIAYLKTLK